MPLTPIMPVSQQKKHTALQKAAGAIDFAADLGKLAMNVASVKEVSKGLDAGMGTGPMDPMKYPMDPSARGTMDDRILNRWVMGHRKQTTP